MLLNLLSNFLLALFLTFLIEILIAFILGYRNKTFFIIIFFINVITNPILNYLVQLNYLFEIFSNKILLILPLEIIVILTEWLILVYVFDKRDKTKLLILSIVMNLASFIIGLVLFGL